MLENITSIKTLFHLEHSDPELFDEINGSDYSNVILDL